MENRVVRGKWFRHVVYVLFKGYPTHGERLELPNENPRVSSTD